MVYTFLDKKTGSRVSVNVQLTKELHKPEIKKFKRRKVYARFKDNIWAGDLAEMKPLSSKNKNVKYLLCVIDVFTKYAWVKLLKDKNGKTVLNAFTEIVNEFNRKPNKLSVDQGVELYNRSIQEWLDNNDILMYSTHNESKSKALKAKNYKKMTDNDSKFYLGYLDKLVKKTINADDSVLTKNIEANLKAPKFKVNDRVKINKYKNIFSKGNTKNWSREIFIIDSALKTNPWTCKIKDLNGEKNNRRFS